MSFGVFVHKFDIDGKLFDGPTNDADNKLASLGEIKGGATTAGDTLKKLEDLITALQSTVSGQQSSVAADIAAVQADVDQNESDADAAIAALQADVDQNESDADAAIAALQAADTALVGGASSAGNTLKKLEDLISALQADVDGNETDADTAIAANTANISTNTASIATLNGSGAGSVSASISTAIANLVDSAPGALDTLNELAAALGDDANFSATITNAIAAVQTDVDQNEADADAAIAALQAADTALVGGASSAGNTLKKLEDLISALQADVDQNESDADTAIAALQADVDQNESDADTAIAALQADVDQNEADADAAIAALQAADTALVGGASSAGNTLKKLEDLISALQADVDQNESDADTAIAALQADVDQNESDADTAIAALQAADTALVGGASSAGNTLKKLEDLISALQADVDQNETDADTAIAANTASISTNTASIATLNGSGAGSVSASIATAIANLVDSAPGALDTLNELAAALGDDANFSATITNAIAAVQTDVDQNEADADAAIASINTTLSGLGTMSTQSASSVNIDGGAIDGTVIGGSSAAAGSFTSLSASGSASMNSSLGVAGTTQLGVLNASGAVSFTDTLAVSGESTFSSGLFPNSTHATVDLGGMQGTTNSTSADSQRSSFFEDSGFTNKAEGPASEGINVSSDKLTFYKDSAFTVAMPSYTVNTTNAPSSWAAYTDNTFSTQITTSGSMGAVILTWTSSTYPDAAERAGDGVRWDRVYFDQKYSAMTSSGFTWDVSNYQARIDFGNAGQLIDSSWLSSTVSLQNVQKATPYVQAEFDSNQGLAASEFTGINFNPGYYGNISITSATLSSGQTFNITLPSDVPTSYQNGYTNNFYFGQSDAPSAYLQLAFSSYNAPSSASDITSVAIGGTVFAHSSIVSAGTLSYQGQTYSLFNVTFPSVPSVSGSFYYSANVGAQEARYFQDISAKRAMRIQSLGSGSAPTLNSGVSGDSALYVKQCPVNYSGSHADELFYLDAAGNTVQFTEGGYVFAPRRAMDATEVLAEDADLSSLPTSASSLKEAYSFDLSAKAGSPSLGGSSQAQSLTLPAPEASDVGREIKFIVLGDMSSANQLTINAGTFAGSGGSFAGQIDGLDSVVLSQPYQVVKVLAIRGQDSTATGAITCWKLV